MRKSRLVLILLLVLLLPLAALAYVAASGERSIRALQLAVATFSPYSLSLREASLRWRPLRFQAELLQLHYANADLPPLLAAQGIDLEMPTNTLWGGDPRAGSFTARNLTYYLDDTTAGADVDLEALLSPLGWLPGEIDIASVHVIRRGENVWVFPLLNVSGRRRESGSLALITETDFGGRRVVFEALGDWSVAAGNGHRLTIDAAFYGPEDDSRLTVAGRIEADGGRLRYELTLNGEYRRVGDFLSALDENAFDIDGALSVAGRLSGDTDGYDLSVEDLTLSQDGSYRFAAKGRIVQRGNAAPEVSLEARGDVQRLTELLPIPEALSPIILRSDLRLTVAGTLQAPLLTAVAVDLYSPGATKVTLTSPDLNVDLARLQTIETLDGMTLRLEATADDLPALLAAAGVAARELAPSAASLLGELRVQGEDLRLELSTISAAAAAYELQGSAGALWRAGVLSLPRVDLGIVPRDHEGRLAATGSIADLLAVHGLALDVDIAGLDPRAIEIVYPAVPAPPEGLRIDARARVIKAADAVWLRDLEGRLRSASGLDARITGDLLTDPVAPEGDLDVDVSAPAAAWADFALPPGPTRASGRVRLRPAYLTTLATLTQGTSELQAVLNAELVAGSPTSLGIDIWGADTRLEDFLPALSNPATQETAESAAKPSAAAESAMEAPWTDRLPDFPLRVTLRSKRLYSDHTELRDVSLAVDGANGTFVLRNFDGRYDEGELSLRGILDLTTDPPSLSVAGQGIRVPLAALTEDLGLQQSITGELSLRGGLSARGLDGDGISGSLRGHLALALSDITVSGAAYDLLMSNLLAWLVQGAGEKTTTFDCTMAQFDIEDGVAHSSEFYVETTRMLATGKGRIDLPANRVDLRIEPRSKSRTFQFPSAIHVRGPLDDPGVEVSGLQATADLSAQALLLLPSLTLKLFGVGRDGDAPRPCRAGAA